LRESIDAIGNDVIDNAGAMPGAFAMMLAVLLVREL
jgi:hypothetical protein